ncbi:unnamed protein product [Mesocestoides corti]|uniref:Secreted protein n=1 Tax=Mesocestoides corti TaxID=53468 RepID=A0A0R3UBR0_MESCO|nr:unnamed protein product [Mesocestoides corti]
MRPPKPCSGPVSFVHCPVSLALEGSGATAGDLHRSSIGVSAFHEYYSEVTPLHSSNSTLFTSR